MSEAEIEEFMTLFRIYRAQGELPPQDRERFRELSKKWRERNK